MKKPKRVFVKEFKINTAIMYIWTTEGWVYLAVVLYICSRNLIKWKTSNYLGKELVIEALNKAMKNRKPKSGLIIHSDRGVQYASHEMCKILEKHNITHSMSNKGNCYDNAITETFFHTLKTELIYSTSYETRQEAELDLFEYIELYYNRQRLHSSLNYLSPVEFDKQFFLSKHSLNYVCRKSGEDHMQAYPKKINLLQISLMV